MTIPGSASPLLLRTAAAAGGYAIERSLRFNSADSAYLSRTPASAGNRKTWTWAGWVKRSGLLASGDHTLMTSSAALDANLLGIIIRDDGLLLADAGLNRLFTAQVFRDTSAWYHIVVSVDTTLATADSRQRMYVNGAEITAFATRNNFAQNADTGFNNTVIHEIGRNPYFVGRHFSGYLADIHFIDGQALDPTSFGEFDATTGVWVPKAYSGPTPTGNSFWLPFSDNSAATATTLGKDGFNLGNNFTPSNLSVTAGAGNDSLVDVPTNGSQTDTGVGGEVRGNYCTWNPLNRSLANVSFSNGNLDMSKASGTDDNVIGGTIQVYSGKWYWEVVWNTISGSAHVGVGRGTISTGTFGAWYSPGYAYRNNGQKAESTSGGPAATLTNYGASWTTGDVIGVALDADNGSITFYKNGFSQGTAFSSLATGEYVPSIFLTGGPSSGTATANFGQRPFAYTAPSGFKALNTANLPAPVVTKPSTVFDVALDTGANILTAAQNKLSTGTDLLWIKDRANTNNHQLIDTVRGGTATLQSNTTAAETTYSAPSGSSVAWCWDAGSSTVTNTQGAISSQVRANASAGFSVVTYTGTGANATAGHGLGIAPGMVIVKRRDTTANWQVRHTSIAAANSIQLNLTNAAASATTVWNSTAPSSTVFSIGTDATVNASGGTYVAYCFAPVAGYSSFGSYTGNGSADGPFVYTGFRPRWILMKIATGGTASWVIWDTARSPSNVTDKYLWADSSNAEGTFAGLDILSNGFKWRSSDSSLNQSNSTYIYAAFAEAPFAANNRAR